MTQTARIYGDSLYDLAVSEALTEPVLEQARAVEALFAENPSWRRLLAEPSVPKAERIGLLDQAFAGKIEVYLLNFLKILCENNLLAEYEGCLTEYQERYDKDRGIARAVVTSAVPLTPKQEETLKKRLEQISGKEVVLSSRISPSVLGGLRIELEGRLIDGTVAGRLTGLQRKLRENIT